MPETAQSGYDYWLARTAPAREARAHYSAIRALDDPVQLARAARIIRLALERGKLTEAKRRELASLLHPIPND